MTDASRRVLIQTTTMVAMAYLEIDRGARDPDQLRRWLPDEAWRRLRTAGRVPGGPVRHTDVGSVSVNRRGRAAHVDVPVRRGDGTWQALALTLHRTRPGRWQLEQFTPVGRRPVELADPGRPPPEHPAGGPRGELDRLLGTIATVEAVIDYHSRRAAAGEADAGLHAAQLDRWVAEHSRLAERLPEIRRDAGLQAAGQVADHARGHYRAAVQLVGDRPERDDLAATARWGEAIRQVVAYRKWWDIDAGAEGLGPRPEPAHERASWHAMSAYLGRVRDELDRARIHQVDLDQPGLEAGL